MQFFLLAHALMVQQLLSVLRPGSGRRMSHGKVSLAHGYGVQSGACTEDQISAMDAWATNKETAATESGYITTETLTITPVHTEDGCCFNLEAVTFDVLISIVLVDETGLCIEGAICKLLGWDPPCTPIVPEPIVPEPIVNQTEPIVNQTEPIVNQTEPVVNQTEPVVNQTQPAAPEPIVDQTPVVNQTEPAAPEPIVDQTPIVIVNQTEPIVNQTKPVVNQTEPAAPEPIVDQTPIVQPAPNVTEIAANLGINETQLPNGDIVLTGTEEQRDALLNDTLGVRYVVIEAAP